MASGKAEGLDVMHRQYSLLGQRLCFVADTGFEPAITMQSRTALSVQLLAVKTVYVLWMPATL